jgi:hypothetical protein
VRQDGLTGAPLGYDYSFNAHSLFTLVSAYMRVTNDSKILSERVGNGTVDDMLDTLATEWMAKRVRRGGRVLFLADYGPEKNNFLEVRVWALFLWLHKKHVMPI